MLLPPEAGAVVLGGPGHRVIIAGHRDTWGHIISGHTPPLTHQLGPDPSVGVTSAQLDLVVGVEVLLVGAV